jgi:hypothetical protein
MLLYHYCLLVMRRCMLHVSTFPRSSSGELQEKQIKFLNCLNMDPYFTVCYYYYYYYYYYSEYTVFENVK